MTEPVVAYSVKEVLTRIESKLDKAIVDLQQLQIAQAAQQAVSRSRAAIYSSVVATAAAAAALLVALIR